MTTRVDEGMRWSDLLLGDTFYIDTTMTLWNWSGRKWGWNSDKGHGYADAKVADIDPHLFALVIGCAVTSDTYHILLVVADGYVGWACLHGLCDIVRIRSRARHG